jgi:periplasmic protein TonB
MFTRLPETQRVRTRTPAGTIVSLTFHVLLVGAALHWSQRTVSAFSKPHEEPVVYRATEPKPDPAKVVAHHATAPTSPNTPNVPTTLPPLVPPVDVPTSLPAIDFSTKPIDPTTFASGAPVGAGTALDGPAGAQLGGDAPFLDVAVEKVAAALPGSAAPMYPDRLRTAGIEGEAMTQFIVDTLGRVEPGSFRVVRATHDAFGDAVRQALPRMRFAPAEARGGRVRMLVQQTFAFTLDR